MGPYSAFPSPGFPTALHCFLSALEWSSTGDGCIYLLHVASSSFIQLPHIFWVHHHPHQVSRPVQRSPLRVFNALLMGPPQPPLHVIRPTLQLLLLVLRISAMLQVRLLRKGSRRNSLCLQTIDNSSTADHIGSIADHQGSVVDSSDSPHGYSKVAAPFSRALPRTQPFSMPLSWALPSFSGSCTALQGLAGNSSDSCIALQDLAEGSSGSCYIFQGLTEGSSIPAPLFRASPRLLLVLPKASPWFQVPIPPSQSTT
ncbi:hypothetical protein XENOCAPTIV_005628 [Xenoophorus captivus]|uniref:Uncharacterized protein n=1 Tax=Xenoophorus captivus TaxID=1517983 RepID=A0ABV0Q5D4_9TELE